MKKNPFLATICTLALLLGAAEAQAKVSPEEAARLGNELTPLGAIRAGNAEGTIPPWEGGITTPPANYKPGMRHPDPYPDDPILFTITAENAQEYADKLSPGQIAMLNRYPDTWYMNVYPTRRNASFPERIYQAAMRNALTAELTEGGNGVINTAEAVPFPIPKEGVEAVWNHLLRFRGVSAGMTFAQVSPTAGGQYTIITIEQKVLFPYAAPGATMETINNKALYFLQTVLAPPRLAGELLLVHDTVDQVREPRKAWTYNPGQRRVRLAPNIAHDNPGTASDGQRTSDNLDMFNGSPERYDWKLVGRKELYVPYNCYKLHSGDLKYRDILHRGHVNPAHLRHELHRVWVVEGTVKAGTRHMYARRTFFIDEDTWAIIVADHYDSRGQIWRVAMGYGINFYEVPVPYGTMEANYDLLNGRYISVGLTNEGAPFDFSLELSVEDFTPEALRRGGRR